MSSASDRSESAVPPVGGRMVRSLVTGMLCMLTLPAVARAQGTSPSTIRATWLGLDADVVNKGGETSPDGEADGHFRIETSFPSWREIVYLALRSADRDGNPAGGELWHTRDAGSRILGVVDGQRMNARHVASLGKLNGPVVLDLYAGDSGWFNAGQTFAIEIGLDGNEVLEAVVRIGDGALAGTPPAVSGAGPAVPADWNTRAESHRGEVGTRYGYTCPPNGTAGPVWGTDVYTDDSSVCTAAVHAGLITLAGGGTVTIEMRGGEASYRGEPRNGITSWNYGAWESSFVFPRPGDPPAAPPSQAGATAGTS
ncbi:MAG TPA: LCCL domain-containing protein, partial [Gemmatimonadota bacterium]|nr:LCCL domain-containing protein [Gemmatimonadota bacterium]